MYDASGRQSVCQSAKFVYVHFWLQVTAAYLAAWLSSPRTLGFKKFSSKALGIFVLIYWSPFQLLSRAKCVSANIQPVENIDFF